MKKLGSLLLFFISGCGSVYTRLPFISQDNMVEERVEDVIYDSAGIFVDFSPETPEESYGNK